MSGPPLITRSRVPPSCIHQFSLGKIIVWNTNFWPIFITVSPHPQRHNDRGRIWECLSSTDLALLFPNLTLRARRAKATLGSAHSLTAITLCKESGGVRASGVSENKPPLNCMLAGSSIPIALEHFPWA